MRRWAALWLLVTSCAPTAPPPAPPAAHPPAAATTPVGSSRAASPALAPAQPEAEHPGYSASEDSDVDDEVELGDSAPPPAAAAPREHPLDGVERSELERRLNDDPSALGSISIGRPSGGALLNAVRMPEGDHWVLVDPAHAWGTRETIDYLEACIQAVHAQFPGSHPLYIGHISAKHGGALSPHVSHQAGRDVDISYFYQQETAARWYARATAKNLDRARTWAFVRALVTHADVEMILIDHSIQALLQEHALEIGEDPAWVAGLFRGKPGQLRPLIVHAKGHATHIHVRFYNPIAQETARRSYDLLIARGLIKPPTELVKHKVKKGETLGMLARKYKTDIAAIRRANALKSTKIVAGRELKIPKRGGGVAAPGRAVVPERRLPPSTARAAGASGAARASPR